MLHSEALRRSRALAHCTARRAQLVTMPSIFHRRANPRIPVLTYHSLNAPGRDYASNDHVALEEDLEVIRACGFYVAPVRDIVDGVLGVKPAPQGNCVGLTFDDGPDFDYRDAETPNLGVVKSFHRILTEHAPRRRSWRHWRKPTAVSFVIASREARTIMDRTCIAGRGQWNDDWWREAHAGGTLCIGNHSWDHTHPTLPVVAQRHQVKGTFENIDVWADADAQIRLAEDVIERLLGGPSARMFAIPYGIPVGYVCNEYLPRFAHQHRQVCCFETGGDYVTLQSDRWRLPRFTFGEHWKSPEELARILAGAKAHAA
jgi:peptidoglycan/xylan/chitin deacetylase (PgdA/CDA1 family)